jgi:hypothetical protein
LLLEHLVESETSHPITKKKHLKAKEEELWKLKYFTMQKNIPNLQNNPLKEETQILQNIITL